MEKYKVKIYPAAQRDLAEIVEYLNTLSAAAALSYYDLLVEQALSLQTMPERFALAQDRMLRLRGYRILPVNSYLIFYVVQDDTVQIRRILYNRRQYAKLI